MIASLYRAARERRWNRDRRRRIAQMRDQDDALHPAVLEWIEAMAEQLTEIRCLPEAPAPTR